MEGSWIALQESLGQTDIYLIDQLMKGRYHPADKILEAGCGGGRNMDWFIKNGFTIYGIDTSEAAILHLKNKYPELPVETFQIAAVEELPFADGFFDHVISSAVLHFAKSEIHFKEMFKEMVRVLKPGGSLFIRMTSDIGIEDKVQLIRDGNYQIPDGSMRFLLKREMIDELLQLNSLTFLEPFKTVNVNDLRCMSTLVLVKNPE
ncbi:MAG: class I SAM-dependent methyltransferase [Ginsengibacter sp.]